ncbi:MAG: hypothetical protein WC766_04850 [Patescibacteria group bacterium]|jgi:hypothetical protein
MVNDEIPVQICVEEQTADGCKGCASVTRRCTACEKTRGIADSEQGLCETCSNKAGGVRQRTLTFKGTPDQAISNVLDRVRDVAEAEQLPARPTTSTQQQSAALASPKFIKDPVALYPILMEHGNLRHGIWKVGSPVTILMRRFHLLRHEATKVLTVLTEKKLIHGAAPWSEVELIKTEGIEIQQAKITNPRAAPKNEQTKRRVVTRQPVASQAPVAATTTQSFEALPSMRPVATYSEIYAFLISKSNLVRDERLVGGAVPALQIRFKLNPAQAIESLEWLVTGRYVQQKDAWRTIVLCAERVESSDGPSRLEQTGKHRPRSGRPIPVRTQTSLPAVQPRVTAVIEANLATSALSPSVLETAMQELERKLPALRKQRDELAQQVAQLEALRALLTLMREKPGEPTPVSQADVLATAQSLLSILKGGS